MSERDRDRDRESGCYDWHYVKTDILGSLVFLMVLWYRASPQPRGHLASLQTDICLLGRLACIFDGNFDTELVLSQGATWPPSRLTSACWLLSKWLTAWGWKTSALYIFWMPIHFSLSLNSRDSFSLSLVYADAYPVLKPLTNWSVNY